MKVNKLIVLSMLVAGFAVQTQAAVYGSLKQDIQVKTEAGETLVKSAGDNVSIIDFDGNDYVITIKGNVTETVNKNLVGINGVITETIVDSTKIRKAANPESEILSTLKADTLIMVLEKDGQFYKVKVDNTVGYVHRGQLNEQELKNVKEVVKVSKGQEIVNYAKTFIGGRYVYGGNNLATGVDCSGFTSQIMKKFGINLQRSSRSQYASNGVKVSVGQLQPGDLVFYGNGGYINHVAIYAGNGQIVHASDSRTGIRMSNLNYGKPIIGCKRVV